MSKQTVLCTYEKIILFKRMPYWIYWPIVGLFLFFIGEITVLLLHEKQFFFTQIALSAGIGLIPVVLVFYSHEFEKTIKNLESVLWTNKNEFEQWLFERTSRMFTLKSWGAKFVTALFITGALLTVFWLGLPLRSLTGNIIAILGFIPVLIIAGQTAYMLLDLLITLRELVFRPANVSFYLQLHPAIRQLQGFFSSVTLVTTLAYIIGALAIWFGPYGVPFAMQIWLTLLAFYPICMFFWSFLHVHVLMQNIKNLHTQIINREVQRTLDCVLKNEKTDDVERLEKIMNIQNKVQTMKEWPVEIQGTLTFIATLATVLIQIVITIKEFLKP